MKTVLLTLVLMTSACLGAENAAPATEIPAAQDSSPDSSPQLNDVTRSLEKAKKAQERAMRDAARAVERAQKRVAEADPTEEGESSEMSFFGGNGGGFALADVMNNPERNSIQPLVVKTTEPDPATVSNLQEDLSVMSRILTKSLGHDRKDSAMGIVLMSFPGSRRPQSLYLEGYGALFMLNVKFPLVPPSSHEEENAEKPVDSTWEKTKQELYGAKHNRIRNWEVNGGTEGAVEYSQEQVETLKKKVVESLKNGSNIRNLKPEESITVAVIGPRAGASQTTTKHVTAFEPSGARKGQMGYTLLADGKSGGQETTLTIRVKKADVDGFSKGTIDLAEFTRRASISAY